MATHFEGQILKLNDSYYIVESLSYDGNPYAIRNCNQYGDLFFPNGDPITASSKQRGFKEIDWKDVTPIKETLADQKYIHVIRKIRQMDKRFAARQQKDIEYANPF